MGVDFYIITIVSIQSLTCAKPHIALVILKDTVHVVIRKTIMNRNMGKMNSF